jgi:hypothetical protein
MFKPGRHIVPKSKSSAVNNPVFFQPKLSISQPNERNSYHNEREAGIIADKVMRMTSSHQPTFFSPSVIQRKCGHCEEEEKTVQKKVQADQLPQSLSQTENYLSNLSGGKALSREEKSFFEPAIGYDLSDVRLHTDNKANESAKDINALAYTHGNNIVFESGQYQPGTAEGKKLLAHELAHVVQQQSAVGMLQRQPKSPGTNIPAANYYVAFLLKGNFSIAGDLFGITQQGEQKFSASDMVHDNSLCLNGSQFFVDINFCRGAPNTAVTPPITALVIEYREPGHFSSLKSVRRDENPVPNADQYRTCWQPNFPTSFKFDVFQKGTLSLTAELFGTDNNELNIYSDTIEIEKCASQKKCYQDAVATNRWLVIPDNGGPMHPLGPSDPDDGAHYEIYAETGTGQYFICMGEYNKDRMYVDRRGYAL